MSGQQTWFMPEMNKMRTEIERLRDQKERLRSALEEIAHMEGYADYGQCDIAKEALRNLEK